MSARNSTPRVIALGIDDQSVPPQLPEVEQLPIHLPLFYTFAEKGREGARLFMPGDLPRLCGSKTIDSRSEYYSHQTLGAMIAASKGNAVYIKRLIPDDARKASLTLVMTIDTTAVVNEYERNADGSVVLDANLDLTFVTPAVVVTGGATVKFEFVPTSTYETGPGVFDFAITGPAATQVIPLYTFTSPYHGKRGNMTGIKLWQATPRSSIPADDEIIDHQESLIYIAKLLEKTESGTAHVIPSIKSATEIEFTAKVDGYDFKTNLGLGIDQLVHDWNDDGVETGLSEIEGPLGEVITHRVNLDQALDALLVIENAAAAVDVTSRDLIGWMAGADRHGIHHYGFQIDQTGDMLVEGVTHFLEGGADGDMSPSNFITLVNYELDFNHENPEYPLMDDARFPFSCLYDTGFPLITKLKFLPWTTRRKDVYVTLATYTDGEDPLTVAEEISVSNTILAAAGVYAESAVYGTAPTRIVIVSQSGELVNHVVKSRQSLVMEWIANRASYGGRAFGGLKEGRSYEGNPGNIVTTMKNISSDYMTLTAKTSAWLSGMNYAQSYDTKRQFYAAFKTIYSSPESVLTGDIFMQICTDIEKRIAMTWRIITGDSKLKRNQFIENSNRVFNGLVAGLYDGRVKIIPVTTFTPVDDARGYSWHFNAKVYGNVPKTVKQATITAYRFTQLEETS